MPRKGQRVKHHRIPAKKHPGPPRYLFERDDPLGRTVLAQYMSDHCEWMLVSGYSVHTVDARRVAIRRFIAWCLERDLDDPRDRSRSRSSSATRAISSTTARTTASP